MKAAILVAGSTTVPRPDAEDLPKTLLPVAGVPILRRLITSLLRVGIDELVIGTGYQAAEVRAAVGRWFPALEVTFVDNPDHATTHNAHTLSLLAPALRDSAFLLFDGDVVFDLAVIEALLERGPDAVAVRSVGDLGIEDVKVTADREDRIRTIGKDLPIRGAMGESIGIALFSASTSRHLFTILDDRVGSRGLTHEYYEAAFQQLIDEGASLYGVDIGSLYATEIDTLDDLRAADARLAQRPAFDVATPNIRLAV